VCADHPYWRRAATTPPMAEILGMLRADISDVLLLHARRFGYRARDWGARQYRSMEAPGSVGPLAWGACGLSLTGTMGRTQLLAIAADECSPDDQPLVDDYEVAIVRHILKDCR
jgi:hypothetical protein